MATHYRFMRPEDISKCVNGIAAHPVLGPRYGRLIEDLPLALHSTLLHDSFRPTVFEEFHGSTTRFLGVLMAAFVPDDFLQEVKTTPFFWVGPELLKRITRGNSPLLSDAAILEANSTCGLNLLMWHNTVHPEDLRKADVGTPVIAAFDESYRGFRLRELMAQADCLEHLQAMRNAGSIYFHQDENRYGKFPEVSAQDFGNEPRNSGLSRDLALNRSGSWVGTLFLYASPQFGFRRSEQRLLILALNGGTDEELSSDLGISLSAVKNGWREIYDRASACLPELAHANSPSEEWTHDRGKQKKQYLLAYIRKHPEELRPISRKLLQAELVQRRPAQG